MLSTVSSPDGAVRVRNLQVAAAPPATPKCEGDSVYGSLITNRTANSRWPAVRRRCAHSKPAVGSAWPTTPPASPPRPSTGSVSGVVGSPPNCSPAARSLFIAKAASCSQRFAALGVPILGGLALVLLPGTGNFRNACYSPLRPH